MSEWQPIETAPRDGTSILVGHTPDQHGQTSVDQAEWDDEGWVARGGKRKSGNWLGYDPTHWMPLPEPPA